MKVSGSGITLSLHALQTKVLEVLTDQAKKGNLPVLSEADAAKNVSESGVSLTRGSEEGQARGGIVSARVLFDGANGISVNSRTRIRHQERAPVATDLKRAMREM